MKPLILLVAAVVMVMSAGAASAQVCVILDQDSGDIVMWLIIDGEEEGIGHINFWDIAMMDFDEIPAVIEGGAEDEDILGAEGWHIEWPFSMDNTFSSDESYPVLETFSDALEVGGFGEKGCAPCGNCGVEGEAPPPPGGLRILHGLDYAGRAIDGETLVVGLFNDDDLELYMEQVGWCDDIACMDTDCGWTLVWDVPEGESEGEPEGELELELGNDLTDTLILGRLALELEQASEMMSVIGLAEEGNIETMYCLEIPWPLAAPTPSGAPVTSMLSLCLAAAACALGGAMTLRKK
jgi:hypothetical protein